MDPERKLLEIRSYANSLINDWMDNKGKSMMDIAKEIHEILDG